VAILPLICPKDDFDCYKISDSRKKAWSFFRQTFPPRNSKPLTDENLVFLIGGHVLFGKSSWFSSFRAALRFSHLLLGEGKTGFWRNFPVARLFFHSATSRGVFREISLNLWISPLCYRPAFQPFFSLSLVLTLGPGELSMRNWSPLQSRRLLYADCCCEKKHSSPVSQH